MITRTAGGEEIDECACCPVEPRDIMAVTSGDVEVAVWAKGQANRKTEAAESGGEDSSGLRWCGQGYAGSPIEAKNIGRESGTHIEVTVWPKDEALGRSNGSTGRSGKDAQEDAGRSIESRKSEFTE